MSGRAGTFRDMTLLVLYNLAAHLIVLCAAPYLLFRAAFDRNFRPIVRRFWMRSQNIPVRGLLVHAVSVGEVAAAKSLVFALQKRFTNIPLVLTTSTPTGQTAAKKAFAGRDVSVTFFPFDVSGAVKRALANIKPRAIILLEAELWPNVVRQAVAQGIPIILLNGRISGRSVRRYRLIGSLMRNTVRACDAFGVRTREDARHLEQLGADPSRITVTGNIKFESSLISVRDEEKRALVVELGLRDTDRLIVAGSTHSGEEEIILGVFKRLKQRVPELKLLLAPRHIDRVNEVCAAVRRAELNWVLRTDKRGTSEPRDVIVLNTTGELARLYALGELAVVGGSFVEGIGGHNPLEPAAAGVPVLFGPHMENFTDIVETLRRHDACVETRDAEELCQKCLDLLTGPDTRDRIARNARQAVVSGGGAVAHSVAIVEQVLRARAVLS